MGEEYFDCVDEHDQVIGRESRREVHRQGLRHRAVHVLLFNKRGEVFLQKRSMSKDTFPGAWDSSASGHLDCGEDYDACAIRELKEELGWSPALPLQRLFKLNACGETGMEFVWIYRGEAEGPFELHPEEIERGGWFSQEKVTLWLKANPEDFASAFRSIWSKLVRTGQVKGTA